MKDGNKQLSQRMFADVLNFCWCSGHCLFIGIGLVFFQQCYKWSRAQLVYCLIPHYLISRLVRRGKESL